MTGRSIHCAIVTALELERDAILSKLDHCQEMNFAGDPNTYFCSSLATETGTDCELVVAMLGMGNLNAASATAKLLEHWEPQNVIMVGIAAGVEGRVNLGDIVVADFCYYYEPSKLTPDSKQNRGMQFRANRLLFRRAQAHKLQKWSDMISIEPPNGVLHNASYIPEVYTGAIASGEKVIADETVMQELRLECRSLLAVAMEGVGVAKAVEDANPIPRFIEIRAICDYGNRLKNDPSENLRQQYAAHAAAAFVLSLLQSGSIHPLDHTNEDKNSLPLVMLCAQSLRMIGQEEIENCLLQELSRESEVVPLNFMDLVNEGELKQPHLAAQRLVDSNGILRGTLARLQQIELGFCGLVHIPLAVLAGHLVTDRQRVLLRDFHPSPGPENWLWPSLDEEFTKLQTHYSSDVPLGVNTVVIRVSVSYLVLPTQTQGVVPGVTLDIDLSLSNPKRSVVRSEQQVREYGQAFRELLDSIAQQYPDIPTVHLFYAGPVALAFHLGQQISQSIHPTVIVWNFNRGYDWAINLREAVHQRNCIIRPYGIAE